MRGVVLSRLSRGLELTRGRTGAARARKLTAAAASQRLRVQARWVASAAMPPQAYEVHQHGSLAVHIVPALEDNYVFVLHERNQNRVAVVDPSEAKPVSVALKSLGLGSAFDILNTHHHWDHTGGNLELKQECASCEVFGFEGDRERIPGISVELKEGSSFEFGDETVHVFETPGHTVGHICFHLPRANVAFVGDTLFAMGCGRLFEGSPSQMHESLQKMVSAFSDDTTIYCAHEYTSSNARFARTVDPNNKDLLARSEQVASLRAENKKTVPFPFSLELATNPFLRCEDDDLKATIGMAGENDASKVFAKVRALKDNF